MDIKYRWNSNWTYKGDFLDFVDAGPEGWGCCVTTIVLVGSLVLAGCGIAKGVKVLTKNDDKQKTEQIAENTKTPANIISYNDVKIR